MFRALLPILGAVLSACASTPPTDAPALRDMEEPLELFEPPRDETQRQALPLGGYTGCYVGAAGGDSLEAMLGEDESSGIMVERVVENSPADAAGLRVGDLLLEAGLGTEPAVALDYASAWRELELRAEPGQQVHVVFDRANRRAKGTITVIARVRPTQRGTVERLREEQRVGVVLRTATEVEARAAGLGPGGGAVVVGLAKNSPWRKVGIRFGDLVHKIGDQRVLHPAVVLDAIRTAEGDDLLVEWRRKDQAHSARAALTMRAHEMHEIFIPPLFSYESDRGSSDTSILLGLFRYRSTEAAWRFRLLWLFQFGGGDADRLIEVDG